MNNYYVYIYYRLDINEPFYVGMGHGNRWKKLDKSRKNKHFSNIVNKYNVAVIIIKDNLTKEQASGIECWIINKLVFEYGYSIDIYNNRSSEKGMHLVNATWGGEGTSGYKPTDEQRLKLSKRMKGKNNPNYNKNQSGENNPMYGKKHTEEWKMNHSKKISGINNSVSKIVVCVTTNKIFSTITIASKFYNCDNSHIVKCCKGNLKSAGKLFDKTKLVWRYPTEEEINLFKNSSYYIEGYCDLSKLNKEN